VYNITLVTDQDEKCQLNQQFWLNKSTCTSSLYQWIVLPIVHFYWNI